MIPHAEGQNASSATMPRASLRVRQRRPVANVDSHHRCARAEGSGRSRSSKLAPRPPPCGRCSLVGVPVARRALLRSPIAAGARGGDGAVGVAAGEDVVASAAAGAYAIASGVPHAAIFHAREARLYRTRSQQQAALLRKNTAIRSGVPGVATISQPGLIRTQTAGLRAVNERPRPSCTVCNTALTRPPPIHQEVSQ
jgi:hypothetical protein